MSFRGTVSLCFAAAAVLVPATARALTLDLSTTYTGATPAGAAPWATVTITDVAPNMVNLRFDHNATSAAGQFITALYLNIDPFVGSLSISNEINGNKRNGALDLGNNGVHGAAGSLFDLGVSFATSNAGGGVNRLKPGEFWSVDLTGTGLNASRFDATNNLGLKVGAHIQGLPNGQSGHITAVPEPASMAVLGLGAAAFFRRRRTAR